MSESAKKDKEKNKISVEKTICLSNDTLMDDDGNTETSAVEETVFIPRGAVPQNREKDFADQDTIVQNRHLIRNNFRKPEKGSSPLTDSFKMTTREREFYQKSVKKKHGISKYRFLEKLVSGGMGAIVKIKDNDLQRISAMKVILPTFKEDEETLNDFIAEAKITALLEHPNIIPVHELGLMKSTGIYFTMKLAEGEALNEIIDKVREGDPRYLEKYNTFHLLRIFEKICDAISFAHSRDILHQDIKPQNIMVGKFGEVLLMDWGLARYIGDPEKETDPVKREILKDIRDLSKGSEELIKGSPSYMAPEQTLGDSSYVDKSSDIFLLGATLYHMFTFEPPYFGDRIYDVLYKAEQRDLIPPEERNPERQIPREICRIIMKAMEREKEDRYGSVEELSRDIDDVISGRWSQQEKKYFSAGKMLMVEGDPGDEAYMILKGKVRVFKGKEDSKVVLGTLTTGDMVGEMALITEEPRTASVQAVENTEVAVLTKDIMGQNLNKLPPFMEKIVSTLSERLKTANMLINPHSTSDSTYFVLEQLRLIFRDKSWGKKKIVSLPYPNLVRELSENLGILKRNVRKVLAKAVKQGYIAVKKQNVTVPDMKELAQYTKFGKLISRLPPERREIVFRSIRRKTRE